MTKRCISEKQAKHLQSKKQGKQGYGLLVLVLAGFAGIAAGLVSLYRATDEFTGTRSVAMLIGAVGGTMFLVVAYFALTRTGISCRPHRGRFRIISPDTEPVMYWCILGVLLILSGAMVGLAIWAVLDDNLIKWYMHMPKGGRTRWWRTH